MPTAIAHNVVQLVEEHFRGALPSLGKVIVLVDVSLVHEALCATTGFTQSATSIKTKTNTKLEKGIRFEMAFDTIKLYFNEQHRL
jgi:hypothetical protein